MTEASEVQANLRAEFKLLGYCDEFKKRFDEFAEQKEVRIPCAFNIIDHV